MTPFHLKEGTDLCTPVAGQGLYLGTTTLLSPTHAPLTHNSQRYYVFMAPEDLQRSAKENDLIRLDECGLFPSYDELADRITHLKKWHGHDGYFAPNTCALQHALEDGQAVGKWVVPPDEVWFGNRTPGSDPTGLMPLIIIGNSKKWIGSFDHRDYIHFTNGERDPIVYAICDKPSETPTETVRIVELPEEDHGTTPFADRLKLCARLVRFVPAPQTP